MLTKTDDTAPHTHKKADAVIFARIQTRKIFYRCFFLFFLPRHAQHHTSHMANN